MPRKSKAQTAADAAARDAAATAGGDTQTISMPRADLTARALAPSDNPEGRATGTATVTVALKYSTGIVLQGYTLEAMNEATPMGFKEIKKAVRKGDSVTINGTRGFRGSTRIEIVNGFALTDGVPKELWDEWLKTNVKSQIVTNGLIFAGENKERVRAECRERSGIFTGMEPITAPRGEKGEKLDPRVERNVQTFKREEETA